MSLDDLLTRLVNRPKDSHKKQCGHCLVIAGSQSMLGAAILTSRAALQSGAGLVTLATVDTLIRPLQLEFPECMYHPMPTTPQGMMSKEGIESIRDYCKQKKIDVIAIGPGCGHSPEMVELINAIVFDDSLDCPIVVDADAITQLEATRCATHPKYQLVLTPHPGEFTTLCQPIGYPYDHNKRIQCALKASEWTQQIIVLKGHETIIAAGDQYDVNKTGNAAMATAGSGDVLTGLIASFIGQGLSPLNATRAAVYIHGKAGDEAQKKYGIGLIASNIIHSCQIQLACYEQDI